MKEKLQESKASQRRSRGDAEGSRERNTIGKESSERHAKRQRDMVQGRSQQKDEKVMISNAKHAEDVRRMKQKIKNY